MYAEAGLLFPYFQSCSPEIQYFNELWCISNANATGKLIQTSTISEYDLGGEGDLFKAPEPINTIVEEPLLDLDLSVAISIISGGEDGICSQAVKVTDIVSMQSDSLLSDIYYACKKELLEKSAIDESFTGAFEIKAPVLVTEEGLTEEKNIPAISDGGIQKSVSSECLTSALKISECPVKPNFMDFQGLNFGPASGMRRAFSEGDIQTFNNGDTVVVQSPRMPTIRNCTLEGREERLSRYRKKKDRRNFGRKIKYACRKALADSQPRVRGRFARINEAALSGPQ